MPDEARQLATRLLNCYLSNLVEFSASPPGFVGKVSERPVASPYARLRAREGGTIVNLRLETVPLTAPSRLVLEHLDGRHDRAALAGLVALSLAEAAAPPGADPHDRPEVRAAAYVDALLPALAQAALLIR